MNALRVKIAYTVTALTPGGVVSVLLNTVRFIDRERFEPVIIVLSQCDRLTAQCFEAENIRVVSFGIGAVYEIKGIVRLYRELISGRYSILHSNPGAVFRIIALVARIPIIVSTYHGTEHFKNAPRRFFDRLLCRWTDTVISISHAVDHFIEQYYNIPDAKRVVIYNGIDFFERFNPKMVFPIPLPGHGTLTITTVAVLSLDKGLDDLIDAAVIVHASYPGARFVVAGEGEDRAVIEDRIISARAESYVHLIGFLYNIPGLLKSSDIFVLPSSKREGLGLALIEAMAMQCPVVGTALEGIREVVDDGINGFLVPPGSPDNLAAAILKLCKDRGLRTRMGQSGRCKVEAVFNARMATAKLGDLYDTLLMRKKHP